MMKKRKIPAEERFWKKVIVKGPNDCWIWTGGTASGYGAFFNGVRDDGAHRFSLELKLKRKLQSGEWALHICDNKICVNPKHLFLGNASINSADMVRKGRKERGTDVGGAKLTETQVRAIRKAYIQGEPALDIAAKYNISRANVLAIANRRSWNWVKDGLVDSRSRAEKYRRGENLSFSKLSEEEVRMIRDLHEKGHAIRALARQFGVNRSTIKQVVLRKTWTHVR